MTTKLPLVGPSGKVLFTNKEEYHAWRKIWRGQYAALSTLIRGCKIGRSELTRHHNDLDKVAPDRQLKITAAAAELGISPDYCWFQMELRRLRRQATEMLELRKESKLEAQRQYLAARQSSAVNGTDGPNC
jgi:hypothetical protein